LLLDFNKALADGLDVADEPENVAATRQSGPSDTVVLPSFCRVAADEDARGRGVHLLAGQMRISARIKFLIINRLHTDNGRDTENVMRV